MSITFNGANLIQIAEFLDTPEIEKFEIRGDILKIEYSDDKHIYMEKGDTLILDDENEIVLIPSHIMKEFKFGGAK